jgi:hypothetical protein
MIGWRSGVPGYSPAHPTPDPGGALIGVDLLTAPHGQGAGRSGEGSRARGGSVVAWAPVDWGDFAVTVSAVVVGGAIGTAGNVWAVRHQLRLEQRARLRETVKSTRDLLGPGYPPKGTPSYFLNRRQIRALQSICWQGVVITSEEHRLTSAVAVVTDGMIELDYLHSLAPPPLEAHRELDRALKALEVHLNDKLRPRRVS